MAEKRRISVTMALQESGTQLRAQADALGKLEECSSRLWRSRNLQEGLDEMLRAVIELLGADKGNIQLLNSERNALTIAVQRGFDEEFLNFFREVSSNDDCACGRALRSCEPVVIEDIEVDTPFAPLRPRMLVLMALR